MLRIVIWILSEIWSSGLTVYDRIFGRGPSVYASLVEVGIHLGRMIWPCSSASIRLLRLGMWLGLWTLIWILVRRRVRL